MWLAIAGPTRCLNTAVVIHTAAKRACLALVTYSRHSATALELRQPLQNRGSVQLVVRFLPWGCHMSNGEHVAQSVWMCRGRAIAC